MLSGQWQPSAIVQMEPIMFPPKTGRNAGACFKRGATALNRALVDAALKEKNIKTSQLGVEQERALMKIIASWASSDRNDKRVIRKFSFLKIVPETIQVSCATIPILARIQIANIHAIDMDASFIPDVMNHRM